MILKEFFELLNKHGIPHDSEIMSDSGWECDATDVDGIYYNIITDVIVLTQGECDKYENNLEWVRLE